LSRRHHEEGAAGVLDVFVQRVVGAQLLLEGDELQRAFHEGDEEQAAEEGAADGVDAVGEGVPAAQEA